MPDKRVTSKKRFKTLFIKRNGRYSSGDCGSKYFKKGMVLDILPFQKEDFTMVGISPAFAEILKNNKHA